MSLRAGLVGTLVATAALGPAAGAAQAKLFIRANEAVFAVGKAMHLQVPGCSPRCRSFFGGPVQVFLRPGPPPRNGVSSDVPPLGARLVGTVTADGRLDLVVPRVPAGRYHLVARHRSGGGTQFSAASAGFPVHAAPAAR